MNLSNLMNLSHMELGLIFIEASLLLSFFILLRHLKRIGGRRGDSKHPLWNSDQFRQWSRESETICQDLSKNLEEKKEIAKRLIAELDERIRQLELLLGHLEEETSSPPDRKRKDLVGQIHEMAEAGWDVQEIAKQLRLSKGEVQLTLDLKRYRQ